MHFTKTKDGGRRHLEFRKSVVTSLLFYQSSPNSMEMLRTWPQTRMSYPKRICNQNQDGGRRHLEFRKSVDISLLLDQSPPNLVGLLRICNRTQLPHWNAYSPELKMVAVAFFIFENRLPFLHYWTNPNQIWWRFGESAMERNCAIKNA